MPKERLEKVAVIGAGNGGCAFAAYFALQGVKVNLCDLFPEYLEGIIQENGIWLTGEHGSGFAKMEMITANPQQAVEGVELVMVVTPAFTHQMIARQIGPVLTDRHVVVLNPGRTAGALDFLNAVRRCGNQSRVVIAETQTLLYGCRKNGSCRVNISGIKNYCDIASIPSTRIHSVTELLEPFYPQFRPVDSILHTSFNNVGMLFHPAPTMLNLGRIEDPEQQFEYYTEGMTPTIVDIIEKIDVERRAVAQGMGVTIPTIRDHFAQQYAGDTYGDTLIELMHHNKCYQISKAPTSKNCRYILEDVPYGMVPFSELGKAFGVATPIIDTFIHLADIIHDKNFREEGRNLQRLGLTGMTPREISEYVNQGF